MDALKIKALEIGLGWLVGPLVLIVVQLLKRYVAWVESRDAWTKRALVVATSAAVTACGAALGVDLGVNSTDMAGLAAIPAETLTAAVGAAVAMALHAVKSATKKKS